MLIYLILSLGAASHVEHILNELLRFLSHSLSDNFLIIGYPLQTRNVKH